MKFPRLLQALFSIALFLTPSPSSAYSNNNVRIDKFDWQLVKTEHFDIYFDKKDQALVPRAAYYLEQAWRDVGKKFNHQVLTRTPFFIYSNHNKFEQNTIVPIGEGTGGVTEAFKNRLIVFNDGSETWLKHVIPHEFTHVVQFSILYGGFWKSIRLLKSPFYPLWMMEGMAEYGAGGIDAPTGDMVVRDAVYTKTLIGLAELQGFNHVKPNQVTLGYKTGEAAIEFLADEYGPDKVGKLLKIMEEHFDVSSGLTSSLGTDLNRFDMRFKEWLREKYADFFDRAKEPVFYGPKLTSSDELPQSNEGLVVSPDGKKIYYFGDRTGSMWVMNWTCKPKNPRSSSILTNTSHSNTFIPMVVLYQFHRMVVTCLFQAKKRKPIICIFLIFRKKNWSGSKFPLIKFALRLFLPWGTTSFVRE